MKIKLFLMVLSAFIVMQCNDETVGSGTTLDDTDTQEQVKETEEETASEETTSEETETSIEDEKATDSEESSSDDTTPKDDNETSEDDDTNSSASNDDGDDKEEETDDTDTSLDTPTDDDDEEEKVVEEENKEEEETSEEEIIEDVPGMPIVGVWASLEGATQTGKNTYRSDGTFKTNADFFGTEFIVLGTYTTEGNKLTLTILNYLGTDLPTESQYEESYTFEIVDNILKLYDTEGTLIQELEKE